MPKITTSRNDEFEALYASAPDIMGNCAIGLPAGGPRLPELAACFDGLEWVDYHNEQTGRSCRWEGYTDLILLSRGVDGAVQIWLAKPRDKEE